MMMIARNMNDQAQNLKLHLGAFDLKGNLIINLKLNKLKIIKITKEKQIFCIQAD